MSRSKWILALVGAAILFIILWQAWGGRGSGGGSFDADAPVPVTVVPASTRNVPVYLANQGTVMPISTVSVQPQVGGQLLRLGFVEGQPVRKGQVLAEIDARSLQAQLDQALAKRAQDQTQLATARANLERLDDPQYAPYVAQIDRITQKNTVAQWEAAVLADEASIQNIRVQLGFTKVSSPIEGIAGIRQVDPGNVITTSTTIVTVTQMHPINVIFTLAGKYLDEVRVAQAKAPLKVAVLDAANNVIEDDGVLKVIDNQIDPNTGSFKLKAEFPNDGNRLFPGQYANTRLQVSVDADALVVPSAAVQRGPNGEYVWLVTNQPATPGQDAAAAQAGAPASFVTMQAVSTGGEAADAGLIILAGLKEGDLVVTAGQFRLKQDSRVTPLKPGEVPAPPSAEQVKAAGKRGSGGGPGGRR